MSDAAFTPGRIGTLRLRNRVLKPATFEGMSPDGCPSDALVEHHRQVARGGAAMTVVAYCSVSPEGRTYGHQLCMREEILPGLRRLTDAVHAEGAAAALQLGHCGSFASKRVTGRRPLAPSRFFTTYGLTFARAMTVDEIERVAEDFATAAVLAHRAGFDAIELHAGHGYLLSQFLSPWTNRRRDRWGGPLENRLRLPLLVVERVREAVGPDYPVMVKVNVEDGFRRGLGVDEAVEVARALAAAGVDALVLSGGFVSKTPLYMLRGEVPYREMAAVQPRWTQRVGLRLFGRLFVQAYPFEESFFQRNAERIRAAVDLPLVLLGGIASRDALDRALAAGFDFVGMGRALVMDPAFVHQLERGEADRSPCDHCNRCIVEMDRGGLDCPCREGTEPG